jgi:hypothetical protein
MKTGGIAICSISGDQMEIRKRTENIGVWNGLMWSLVIKFRGGNIEGAGVW